MKLTLFLLTLLASFISAHSGPASPRDALPKFIGGSRFRARENIGLTQPRAVEFGPAEPRSPSPVVARTPSKVSRQAAAGASCGPGIGSCGAGLCCSSDGICGTGIDFCEGPDCQYEYGPACDANTVPSGATTSNIPRPQLGSVPYGVRINDCTEPGKIALTFDDGPYLYTSALLDLLDQYPETRVTFFITGNNLGKGQIDDCTTGYPQIIQRAYAAGHQLASHSWTHQDLLGLSQTYFNHQMYYNEMAFRNILGFFPTYMRPPYVDCDDECFSRLNTLGYHPIYYDLDTFDYLNDAPDLIQNSKDYFTTYLNDSAPDPTTDNMLSLSHDIHYQTVYNLTQFMIETIAAAGYGSSVTVGECLGDPEVNWYRSAAPSPTTCTVGPSTTVAIPPPTATGVSTDGTCGAGLTCLGSGYGDCCSRYNFCGSTDDYCGLYCQPTWGSCNSAPTSTPTAPVVSTEGSCGSGVTCSGSTYGNCCSKYGFCGSTSAYCGTGCQPDFGSCTS